MRKSNCFFRPFVTTVLALFLFLTQIAFVFPGGVSNSKPSTLAIQASSIGIDQWYVHKWSLILSPYSCYNTDGGCWANPNYHEKSWLLSKQSVAISPTWNNPALVYWTRHYSRRLVNFCYVEIQVAGDPRWDRVKTIGGTKNEWYQTSVDLKAYSGKSILVKFYCEPNLGSSTEKGSYWRFNKQILYVQDVQIVPDYTKP